MQGEQGTWQRTVRLGGRDLVVEGGWIARQAGGAALLSRGRDVVLVTVVAGAEPTGSQGFFPLTVHYREKLAGAGRIPGGFLRRETRPTDEETLTSRLIDRSIRPFFPEGFRGDTQLLATALSHDPDGDAAVLAITGASAALTLSDVPWGQPMAGLRVSRIDGELRLFAGREDRRRADLDLLVSVSRGGLVMVEGSAHEVPDAVLVDALDAALHGAEPLLALQEELRERVGKPKRAFRPPVSAPELRRQVGAILGPKVGTIFGAMEKADRRARIEALLDEVASQTEAGAAGGSSSPAATAADGAPSAEVDPGPGPREIAEQVLRDEIRKRALDGRRLDGRGPRDVRPISGRIGWLPNAHGSAVFTRGETQAMVTCTLGTSADEQLVEGPEGLRKEAFLLHYTFPPYSVGEVRPMRGPGRREIGHGALARRALEAILPAPETYPFTLRLDAEITASNGSSSMATVCGSALAMMDAGVPLTRPVAGVAMGLIVSPERSIVLTDILGDEDHLGDMDFKVAGTCAGVTAVQLDNKIGSLPRDILQSALEQARQARVQILEEMARICPAPRSEPRPHVPQVRFLRIRPARIRDLIGPGGRHIQGIEGETGAKISVDDQGRVRVYGPPGTRIEEAERRVRFLTGEPRIGAVYRGRVTGVTDFGCFVELFQGIEGLVHISELAEGRIDHPSSVTAEGEELIVKVLGASEEGKIRLSRRAAEGVDPGEVES